MKKLQQDLPLTVQTKVTYEVLPAMLVEGEWLPMQIDVQQVLVEIPDVNGKMRNVNLLPALDESTIISLEDELFELLRPQS